MPKITIEQEDTEVKIEATMPFDSTVREVLDVFYGMLISYGYYWESIENTIKEMSEEFNITKENDKI
jgi:hypothetical protein